LNTVAINQSLGVARFYKLFQFIENVAYTISAWATFGQRLIVCFVRFLMMGVLTFWKRLK